VVRDVYLRGALESDEVVRKTTALVCSSHSRHDTIELGPQGGWNYSGMRANVGFCLDAKCRHVHLECGAERYRKRM
jgi:hypothetical protein